MRAMLSWDTMSAVKVVGCSLSSGCEAGVAPLRMRHASCAVCLLHSIPQHVKQMMAQLSSGSQREGRLHQANNEAGAKTVHEIETILLDVTCKQPGHSFSSQG